MSSKFLVQKVNWKNKTVSAWFLTTAQHPMEAIDHGFDRWAPDVHPGLRSVRGGGAMWQACLRDAQHSIRVFVEAGRA